MDIRKGTMDDLTKIAEMYIIARRDLEENDIYQWDHNDPSIQMLQEDIKAGDLYVAVKGDDILGSIVLNDEKEPEHKDVDWSVDKGRALYLHRLVVHLDFQGEGTGKALMNFADEYAEKHGYTSIRLDAYEENEVARGLYENFGYEEVGKVFFPRRDVPFYSYEKEIGT
ncbi:GNAT family N-acetyltransferase [Shimazuella kribbensis]|uniref:GNAT family N-acetyltransferase n=1 Tax=Shimazuella kribbensis TaxID=139808 RepID=UPI000420351C|nr:GNAT family N-acetyltransferase [Shimazuella kribbensis]